MHSCEHTVIWISVVGSVRIHFKAICTRIVRGVKEIEWRRKYTHKLNLFFIVKILLYGICSSQHNSLCLSIFRYKSSRVRRTLYSFALFIKASSSSIQSHSAYILRSLSCNAPIDIYVNSNHSADSRYRLVRLMARKNCCDACKWAFLDGIATKLLLWRICKSLRSPISFTVFLCITKESSKESLYGNSFDSLFM